MQANKKTGMSDRRCENIRDLHVRKHHTARNCYTACTHYDILVPQLSLRIHFWYESMVTAVVVNHRSMLGYLTGTSFLFCQVAPLTVWLRYGPRGYICIESTQAEGPKVGRSIIPWACSTYGRQFKPPIWDVTGKTICMERVTWFRTKENKNTRTQLRVGDTMLLEKELSVV